MANPYFNATYYLTNNPDVFAAGINTVEGAWNHYVNHGAAESLAGAASRQPAPWFDAVYYLQNNADLSTAGLTAGQLFDHFTTFGIGESRTPSANAVLTEANLLAYAKGNADLLEAFKIDPAATTLTAKEQADLANHFYQHGYKEDRANAPFDADVDPGKVGQTFTLTPNVDNLPGTDGDDTFIGGSAQIQAADVMNGQGGTDTARLYLDAAGTVGLNSSNIEIFELQSSNGTSAFNAVNVKGAEQFISSGSTAGLTINNIQNNAVLGLVDTGSNLTATFKAGVVGTAGTLAITTANSGTGTLRSTVQVNDGGNADKFTSLSINAISGKYGVTLDGTAGATDFTSIATTGAGGITVAGTNNSFQNVTKVDMQAAGGSTVNLAGNTKDVTVTGGAGNDNIIFAAGQFTTNDSVDLGAGKNTLTLGNSDLSLVGTDPLTKAINAAKNVQVLATNAVGTAGVQINADRYASINEFKVVGDGGTASITGSAAVSGAAAASAGVAFSGVASDGSDTLVITEQTITGGAGAAGTGGSAGTEREAAAGVQLRVKLDSGADAVNLVIGDSTGAVTITGGAGADGGTGDADGANGNALDARQFETLNITVGNNVTFDAGTAGSVGPTSDVLVGGNGKITLAGKGDVDLGTVAANSAVAEFQNLTIDASTLEGKLTVVTGAGNDVIKAGTKGSDITGGTGLDQITLGAGQDVVKVAAGDSGATVTTTSISGIDVVTGFTAGANGDQVDFLGVNAGYTALNATQLATISTNSANLKAATDAALAIATASGTSWTAFSFGNKTYAVYDTDATYDATNGVIVELVGVNVADLVATNFA